MVDLQKLEEDFRASVKESAWRHDMTDTCAAKLKAAMIDSQRELKDGLIESNELFLGHLQKLEEEFRPFVKESSRQHDATDSCLTELKDAMICSRNELKDDLVELKNLILGLNLPKSEADFRAFVKESAGRHDATDRLLAELKDAMIYSNIELKELILGLNSQKLEDNFKTFVNESARRHDTTDRSLIGLKTDLVYSHNELKELILGMKKSSRSSPNVSGGCASDVLLWEGVLGVDPQIRNAYSDVEFSTSYRGEQFVEVDCISENEKVTTAPAMHLDGLASLPHKTLPNTFDVAGTTTCSELVHLTASKEVVVTLINGEHAISLSCGGSKIQVQMPTGIFQSQTLRKAYLEQPSKQSQLPVSKTSLVSRINCSTGSYYRNNEDCLAQNVQKQLQVGISLLLEQPLIVVHPMKGQVCSREIVERSPNGHSLLCNDGLAPGLNCKKEESHIDETDEKERLKEVDEMPSATEVNAISHVFNHAVECYQGLQKSGASLHSGCNQNLTEVGEARRLVREPTVMVYSSVEAAMENTLPCTSSIKNFDLTVCQNEIGEEVEKLEEVDKMPSPTEVYTISQVSSHAVECTQGLQKMMANLHSGCNNSTEVGAAREPFCERTAMTCSRVAVAMENKLSCSSRFKNFDSTVCQNEIDEDFEKLEVDKTPLPTKVNTISQVPSHAVECSQGLWTTEACSCSGYNHNLTEVGAAREPVREPTPTAMTCSSVEVALENTFSCTSSFKNFDLIVRQNDCCQIGGALSKKTKPSQKKSLIDEVFSWSVDDILNGDLLVNKLGYSVYCHSLSHCCIVLFTITCRSFK